ncbi:MAG: agmatinase [Gammaproteobacteria bacterium]|nr:MAG: agmatinase [Gammaproteobacteria bacterium]
MSLHWQHLPNAAPEAADVLIQPLPFEATACFVKGTARAPEAILAAADQLEYYEEDLGWSPMQWLRPCVLPPLAPSPEEVIAEYLHRIGQTVRGLPDNALYIGLGGEHSLTPPQVEARMHSGTIVVIDAHADLRDQYQGSPYSHACPMRRLHEAGYRLELIGVRSLYEGEAAYLQQHPDIGLWRDRALREPRQWQALLERLQGLEGPVWLSIDMDGLDPALVPGVGTPQPGGLDWFQTLAIIETLLDNPQVDLRGVDLVELIPDPHQVSQTVAAKLVQKIISRWAWPRVDRNGTPTGAQTEIAYE